MDSCSTHPPPLIGVLGGGRRVDFQTCMRHAATPRGSQRIYEAQRMGLGNCSATLGIVPKARRSGLRGLLARRLRQGEGGLFSTRARVVAVRPALAAGYAGHADQLHALRQLDRTDLRLAGRDLDRQRMPSKPHLEAFPPTTRRARRACAPGGRCVRRVSRRIPLQNSPLAAKFNPDTFDDSARSACPEEIGELQRRRKDGR